MVNEICVLDRNAIIQKNKKNKLMTIEYPQTENIFNSLDHGGAIKLLDKMGIQDKKDAYPCNLSGGQQQRVSIARALAIEPEILFMDEPTSALDPELIGEVLKVIKKLAEEKKTMVIVTHEIQFASQVADRIIFMDKGSIIEMGTPKEVIENPKEERTKQFLQRYLERE